MGFNLAFKGLKLLYRGRAVSRPRGPREFQSPKGKNACRNSVYSILSYDGNVFCPDLDTVGAEWFKNTANSVLHDVRRLIKSFFAFEMSHDFTAHARI